MFTSIQHWFVQNPVFALMLWGCVSACVNAGFEYVELHKSDSPWARAADGFFQMFGLDAGVVVNWLRNAFGGPPAAGGNTKRSAAPPGAGTDVKRGTSVLRTGVLLWADAGRLFARTRAGGIVLLAALAGFTASGCKLLHDAVPVLSQIVGYITDAEAIISGLEQAAQLFFLAHPDEMAQAKFMKADARLRASLDGISRLAAGGKDLDSEDMVAAIKDFQGAYTDFAALLRSFGVSVPPAGNGTLGAHVQTEPLLMTVHTTAAAGG